MSNLSLLDHVYLVRHGSSTAAFDCLLGPKTSSFHTSEVPVCIRNDLFVQNSTSKLSFNHVRPQVNPPPPVPSSPFGGASTRGDGFQLNVAEKSFTEMLKEK